MGLSAQVADRPCLEFVQSQKARKFLRVRMGVPRLEVRSQNIVEFWGEKIMSTTREYARIVKYPKFDMPRKVTREINEMSKGLVQQQLSRQVYELHCSGLSVRVLFICVYQSAGTTNYPRAASIILRSICF